MTCGEFKVVEGSSIGSSVLSDLENECEEAVSKFEDNEDLNLNRAEDYNNWGCCIAWTGTLEDRQKAVGIFKKGLKAEHRNPANRKKTVKAILHNKKLCELPVLWEEKKEDEEA
jgi:hypothetical protein